MAGEATIELLRGALGGAEDDREQLLERLRPRLVLWAATRLSRELRAKVEPEDVAQETLLDVHRGLPAYRGDAYRPFLAWVFTIAENRIRDLAKRFSALKRTEVVRPVTRRTSPSEAASRTEDVERLRDALGRLSTDHQEIVRLVRLEDREYAEVAALLGRTEQALRVRYCRALQALRAEMAADAARTDGSPPDGRAS